MMRLTSSGIEVAAQGQALEAGTVGDRIRVLNPVSHAILFATVTDQNEVRIDPDSTPFMRVGGGAYQTFDAGNSYAQASILHYGQAGSLNGSER